MSKTHETTPITTRVSAGADATSKPSQAREYQDLAPLFRELADTSVPQSRRQQVRDRLVTGYLPLAQHLARRFRNRGQPDDDLTQVATIGLINAVDRFDPDRGTDFLSFAIPTITGEIRRYFRDATWSIRVPRRLKELHATIDAEAARLGQKLGRSPRPTELAAELNLSVEDVYEGLQAGYAYRSEPLDHDADEDDGANSTGGHIGVTDPDLASVENREALYPALSALNEREASILVMRFFGDMTQTQIAKQIGLSQMHVSRLLADSLKMLRASLDGGEALS